MSSCLLSKPNPDAGIATTLLNDPHRVTITFIQESNPNPKTWLKDLYLKNTCNTNGHTPGKEPKDSDC